MSQAVYSASSPRETNPIYRALLERLRRAIFGHGRPEDDFPPFDRPPTPAEDGFLTNGNMHEAGRPGRPPHTVERDVGSIRATDDAAQQAGNRARSQAARAEARQQHPGLRDADIDTTLTHAEGAATTRMASNSGLRNVVLDINNTHICASCIRSLRYLVPDGKTLTVRFTNSNGANISVKFKPMERPQLLMDGEWTVLRGTADDIAAALEVVRPPRVQ